MKSRISQVCYGVGRDYGSARPPGRATATKERIVPSASRTDSSSGELAIQFQTQAGGLRYFYAERSSRLPLYQNSSFSRERAARGPRRMINKDRPRTYRAEYMRSFRPEVRMGLLSTLKRPSFLRARLK